MTETVGTGQSHEEPLLDHCMYLGSNKAMLHTEQQLQAIVDIIIRVAASDRSYCLDQGRGVTHGQIPTWIC